MAPMLLDFLLFFQTNIKILMHHVKEFMVKNESIDGDGCVQDIVQEAEKHTFVCSNERYMHKWIKVKVLVNVAAVEPNEEDLQWTHRHALQPGHRRKSDCPSQRAWVRREQRLAKKLKLGKKENGCGKQTHKFHKEQKRVCAAGMPTQAAQVGSRMPGTYGDGRDDQGHSFWPRECNMLGQSDGWLSQ